MMEHDNNIRAFLALVRAGLWEHDVKLQSYEPIDYSVIYKLSVEQSVIGIVAAGLEHVVDVKIPKYTLMQFASDVLVIEQMNKRMNVVVNSLFHKLEQEGIFAVLIKGQGVAQCYERPLWRASGDIDLLLDVQNYKKAKEILSQCSSLVEEEDKARKHIGFLYEGFLVELHGSLNSNCWSSLNKNMSLILFEIINNNKVRIWYNNDIPVLIPAYNEDVLVVFSHILQHFFRFGIGLRQICDWCRLLWTCHDVVDGSQLKQRLNKMGLMSEWNVFSSLSVHYLGMEFVPLSQYLSSNIWKKKAKKVLAFIFETGNFGHNRDYCMILKYPYFIRKIIALWVNTMDSMRCFQIFPLDSLKAWSFMFRTRLIIALKGA